MRRCCFVRAHRAGSIWRKPDATRAFATFMVLWVVALGG
jgi:hypothetical protein